MSLQISNLHPDTSVQDLEKYLKPYGSLAAPISIRYHGNSDSCSAVVHYDSVDASVSVMTVIKCVLFEVMVKHQGQK